MAGRVPVPAYFPNPTNAKKTLARIEESIAMGTWPRLKEELTPSRAANADQGNDPTIQEFAEIYLDKYCKVHNKRPDCKQQVLKSVTRILGNVRVKSLRRADVHHFIAERSQEVDPATVNRGVAVLKNMLTFALEREILETHPLLRFRMLKEDKPALRVMTLQEERLLIQSIDEPVIAAYAAVLGETGLRKQEGLQLKWDQINLDQRILSVQYTKSRKPRYVPLSDFAIEWLRSLIRVVGCPYVFARLESRDRWRKPEGPFNEGRVKASLDLDIDSRLASLSGNTMGAARSGSPYCSRIARAQFHYNHDAVCPLRCKPRVALDSRSSTIRAAGSGRQTGDTARRANES